MVKKTFCTNKRCNKATCVKNPGFKTSCPNPYPSPRAIIATTYFCTSLGLRQPLASSAAPSKRRAWQAYQKKYCYNQKNPAKLIVPLTIFYGFPQVFMVLLQFSMAFINLSTCFLRFSIRFIDFSTVVLRFSVAFLDFATFFFNFLWHHRFSIVWFSFHVFNGLSIVL